MQEQPTRLIRIKKVMEMTGLSRSTIYKMMAQKLFPHSIQLGIRAVAWIDSDVQDWIDEHVRLARQQ